METLVRWKQKLINKAMLFSWIFLKILNAPQRRLNLHLQRKPLTTVTVNSPKMATFESPHFTANDGHCIKICVTFVWAIALDENGFGPFCRR